MEACYAVPFFWFVSDLAFPGPRPDISRQDFSDPCRRSSSCSPLSVSCLTDVIYFLQIRCYLCLLYTHLRVCILYPRFFRDSFRILCSHQIPSLESRYDARVFSSVGPFFLGEVGKAPRLGCWRWRYSRRPSRACYLMVCHHREHIMCSKLLYHWLKWCISGIGIWLLIGGMCLAIKERSCPLGDLAFVK